MRVAFTMTTAGLAALATLFAVGHARAQNVSVPIEKGDRGHIALDAQVNDGDSLDIGGAGVSLEYRRTSAGVFVGGDGAMSLKGRRTGDEVAVTGKIDVPASLLSPGRPEGGIGFGLGLTLPFNGPGRPLREPPPIALDPAELEGEAAARPPGGR